MLHFSLSRYEKQLFSASKSTDALYRVYGQKVTVCQRGTGVTNDISGAKGLIDAHHQVEMPSAPSKFEKSDHLAD